MTDGNQFVGSVRRRIRRHVIERRASTERAHIVSRLDAADYLSLGALFWAWVAILLMASREPNWGIVAMLAAFGFDKLDGYVARQYGLTSSLGLQIDSYIDAFTYLVTGGLLYHFAVSPTPVLSAVVGFALLTFGGLRLIRHTNEGFGDDDGTSYYRGITVVHANVVVVASYFVTQFGSAFDGWLAAPVIVAISPVMVSDYKSYKTAYSHVILGVLAVVAMGLALAIEYGLVS